MKSTIKQEIIATLNTLLQLDNLDSCSKNFIQSLKIDLNRSITIFVIKLWFHETRMKKTLKDAKVIIPDKHIVYLIKYCKSTDISNIKDFILLLNYDCSCYFYSMNINMNDYNNGTLPKLVDTKDN